ncbi:MAG: alpha/beta fold hydrolase [Fuerstiella sp.]|nr:alpha/beta fold hydrolase [Fuerstiella sp.]MCP4783505.1 alpha/beta fold hydrolase [Fuerstiella sp.]MCP4854461.1 alpha/beta fold hydrolase [Fuerstiella sp.]
MPEQRGKIELTSDFLLQSKAPSTPDLLAGEPPSAIAPFEPAAGLSNGHLQTLFGAFRPARPSIAGTVQRKLCFPDGDFAVLHDDTPEKWSRGDQVVLLMHGLAGCHQSGYMARTAAKLLCRNVRVFRMDHRGCGAGEYLAENPYHAGRIRDLEAAIRMLERLCPSSLVSVAGFSLSGNLLLRYLGDDPAALPASLYRAVAICPPVDLKHCVEQLGTTRMGQRYDWYFARRLVDQLADKPQWREDVPLARAKRPPRRIIEFDELYTAPASGFDSAEHYYAEASARPFIGNISVSTAILAAEDDPMVCSDPLKQLQLPSNVELCLTQHGGHLGFMGRKGIDADQRWMDWRVVDWLLN